MRLMSIISFIVISGIFGRKYDDLDILPPPPPFPEIGEAEKELEETERKDKREEGERLEKERKAKNLKVKKRGILGKIFGKKDEPFEKELKELEKLESESSKKGEIIAPKKKLKVPVFEQEDIEKVKEQEKPHEVVKAEEEIERAIKKIKKRPTVLKTLFGRKKVTEERVEIPRVMPKAEIKIDEIEIIEETMHKARLALMDFKVIEAKRIYIQIMRMYNELESEKKAKVYQDIKDLYYERKSAEKFAK